MDAVGMRFHDPCYSGSAVRDACTEHTGCWRLTNCPPRSAHLALFSAGAGWRHALVRDVCVGKGPYPAGTCPWRSAPCGRPALGKRRGSPRSRAVLVARAHLQGATRCCRGPGLRCRLAALPQLLPGSGPGLRYILCRQGSPRVPVLPGWLRSRRPAGRIVGGCSARSREWSRLYTAVRRRAPRSPPPRVRAASGCGRFPRPDLHDAALYLPAMRTAP